MKPLTFKASSAIKEVSRTRQHIAEGDIVSACITKNLNLELTAQRWQELEEAGARDPDWSILDEITSAVQNFPCLKQMLARREEELKALRASLGRMAAIHRGAA